MILVIAKDGEKFRQLTRRSGLTHLNLKYASSPHAVEQLDPADVETIWDYGESFDNRRYTAIREACEKRFPNAEWEYPA